MLGLGAPVTAFALLALGLSDLGPLGLLALGLSVFCTLSRDGRPLDSGVAKERPDSVLATGSGFGLLGVLSCFGNVSCNLEPFEVAMAGEAESLRFFEGMSSGATAETPTGRAGLDFLCFLTSASGGVGAEIGTKEAARFRALRRCWGSGFLKMNVVYKPAETSKGEETCGYKNARTYVCKDATGTEYPDGNNCK